MSSPTGFLIRLRIATSMNFADSSLVKGAADTDWPIFGRRLFAAITVSNATENGRSSKINGVRMSGCFNESPATRTDG